MAQLFEKNLENPNFCPYLPKYKSSNKIEQHQFLWIKNSYSHGKKNERSNVEISRKTVNRPPDEQTINAFEDPCTIYGIVSQEVLSLFLKYLSTFSIPPFSKMGHPLCNKETILSIYGIITLHYNHHHINRKTDTYFSF